MKRICAGTGFYLATPPDVYLKIIEQIGKAGLAKPKSDKSWTRDYREAVWARQGVGGGFEAKVLSVFSENQVYRIDHYLGKEPCKYAGLPVRQWNFRAAVESQYIDHIQITAAESLGWNGGVLRERAR